MTELERLKNQFRDILGEMQDIVNLAEAEAREITASEEKTLKSKDRELVNIRRQIEGIESGILTPSQGPLTVEDYGVDNALTVADGSRISYSGPGKSKGGFKDFGEFGVSVYKAGLQGQRIDNRLLKIANASTTVSTEGVGADGGYLVPPDFRDAILRALMDEYQLLGLCDKVETTSNELHMPADESTAWGSSGVQAYWTGENQQMTQSKPALKEKIVRLNKLYSLIPITSEMLEDSASVDAYLRRRVPETLNYKISHAIVHGTGSGTPQGILNCASKIEVAAESGQSADTVVAENILNMWSRLYPPCHARAVWLAHPDTFPELANMFLEGTSSSIPMWMPANGAAGAPYSTLMGRPLIFSQVCETIGDAGDLILGDFSQYLVGLKSTGIRSDVSIHLWFDYDTVAYRFVMRVGGQCWWSAAIDPRDGTNTMSAFVTLAART